MLNNGNSKNCGFDDLMVSYIYDEITIADRRKFETHLVDCSVCTEEFAEISGARFSVFEWQKEAFAELPTPEIVIPYEKSRGADAQQIGFFAGLRALLGGFGIPLAAGAGLLIVLGIGFAAMTLTRNDNQIAANVVVEQPKVSQNTAVEKPSLNEPPAIASSRDTVIPPTATKAEAQPTANAKPIKAVVETRRVKTVRPLTAETANRIKPDAPQIKKAPALSNYDDASDRSLRLTDLFDDEVGSIR
ncbi:MAG: hypothetical protein QM785_13595 [Pyrinomonadaceae bacterium]